MKDEESFQKKLLGWLKNNGWKHKTWNKVDGMTTIEPLTEEDGNKIFIVLLKECRVRFSEFGVEHPRFSFKHDPEVMEKLKKSGSNFIVITDLTENVVKWQP